MGKLKAAIFETVRNNPKIKKIFYNLLWSPLVTKNPLYFKLYNFNVKKKTAVLEKKPPYCVQIENTSFCNISCIFCAHESMARKQGIMKTSLYEHIVDQCASLGIFQIHLGGFGEPLMDKDYALKVKYAKSRGIKRVFSVTNAILLKEDLSREIVKSGLDYLGISIDAVTNQTYGRIHKIIGSEKSHNLYDKVHENIETLVRVKKEMGSKKPFIQVRFKDFEVNKGEMPEFIKKYTNLVDQINIYQNVTKWPGSDKDNNFNKQVPLLYFPCYNLWTTLYVCSDGRVSLCVQDYDCRIEMGNLENQQLTDIWFGAPMRDMRKLHLERKFDKISVCRDCDINSHIVNPWWISE